MVFMHVRVCESCQCVAWGVCMREYYMLCVGVFVWGVGFNDRCVDNICRGVCELMRTYWMFAICTCPSF